MENLDYSLIGVFIAIAGVSMQILTMVVGIFLFLRKAEQRMESRFAEQDKCMHRLHGENTTRITVIESRVSDLWEKFIDGAKGE